MPEATVVTAFCRKKIMAAFEGGRLSSNSGVMSRMCIATFMLQCDNWFNESGPRPDPAQRDRRVL